MDLADCLGRAAYTTLVHRGGERPQMRESPATLVPKVLARVAAGEAGVAIAGRGAKVAGAQPATGFRRLRRHRRRRTQEGRYGDSFGNGKVPHHAIATETLEPRAVASAKDEVRENARRFPSLDYWSAADPGLHSTAPTRYEFNPGDGETISRLPTLAILPRKLSK